MARRPHGHDHDEPDPLVSVTPMATVPDKSGNSPFNNEPHIIPPLRKAPETPATPHPYNG